MALVHRRGARDFVRLVLKKHMIGRALYMFILEVAKLFRQSLILAGIEEMGNKLRLIVLKVFFKFSLFLGRDVFISAQITATI